MTAPYNLSVFPKYESDTRFWNNQSKAFGSPYNMILHDPECQDNCCFGSTSQQMHAQNFNDMGQCPNFTVCYSDESSLTSTSCENQFFYDGNYSNYQESELQEVLSRGIEDQFGMVDSEFDDEKTTKIAKYDSPKTNLVQSKFKQKSDSKNIMKRKRKRTVFNTEQIVIMEGVFKKRPYVCREERLFLSQKLNISEKTIKIWFQNRRRVTEKRERDHSDSYHSDSTVEEVCNDYNTRLDYIESELNQNTDEHGFVTLDSKSLTELVKLIDTVLSNSIHYHDSVQENKYSESSLMYEPVSPESLSDDNKESDNIMQWQPSKPEESLQRLIDIQTVLYS